MKRMKRRRWICAGVLIAVLLLAAFMMRLRFAEGHMEEYFAKAVILPSVYSDQFDPSLSTTVYEIFDNSLDTYEELEQKAGDIVIGEVMSQCQDHGVVKTAVQIHQVIKGKLTNSQTIMVYEPVNFTEDARDFPDGRLEGSPGYLLMKKGRPYVLFLQDHPYSDGYNLVSDLYGKIPAYAAPKFCHLEYTGEYMPLSQLDEYDAFYVDPKEDKAYLKEEMSLCEDKNSDEYARLQKKAEAFTQYENYERKLKQLWQECQDMLHKG